MGIFGMIYAKKAGSSFSRHSKNLLFISLLLFLIIRFPHNLCQGKEGFIG